MDIILDANALIADFSLTSPAYRLLFDGVTRLDAQLFIAEVSVKESAAKFRGELAALRKSAERLQRLSGRQIDLGPVANLDELVSEYEARVAGKFAVLPTPPVTHASVVDRILAERSPSRGGDRGYRDALIWETVLERLAAHRGTVLLVTNDEDFSDKSGRPHPDLLADMDARSLSRDRLTIYKAVALLNKERVEPLLAAVTNYETLLKEDAFPGFSLHDWFLEEIPAHKVRWVPGCAAFRISDKDSSSDTVEVSEIHVSDVKGLDDGDLYVQAEATFEVRFRVSSDVVEDGDRFQHYYDPDEDLRWSHERSTKIQGDYVAYAELVLQPDGDLVSAELNDVDKVS